MLTTHPRGYKNVKLLSGAADLPSLLSLNTPPVTITAFNCRLLLWTAYSNSAASPPSEMPPALIPYIYSNFLVYFLLFAAQQNVSTNTSVHKSAIVEQRQHRVVLISALLKPAAILKLILFCEARLSLSSPLVSLRVSGQQLHSVFLSCLPACPVTDCTIHINYSWLLSLRFTGKTNHRWSHC